MANFNIFNRAIKESINVDFRDRHSPQKVILCNRENEFYGRFFGEINGTLGVLSGGKVGLTNVDLSGVRLFDSEGKPIDLSSVTQAVEDFRAQVYETWGSIEQLSNDVSSGQGSSTILSGKVDNIISAIDAMDYDKPIARGKKIGRILQDNGKIEVIVDDINEDDLALAILPSDFKQGSDKLGFYYDDRRNLILLGSPSDFGRGYQTGDYGDMLSISTTDFVKDGMIERIDIVGGGNDTKLVFTQSTEGQLSSIPVNMKTVLDRVLSGSDYGRAYDFCRYLAGDGWGEDGAFKQLSGKVDAIIGEGGGKNLKFVGHINQFHDGMTVRQVFESFCTGAIKTGSVFDVVGENDTLECRTVDDVPLVVGKGDLVVVHSHDEGELEILPENLRVGVNLFVVKCGVSRYEITDISSNAETALSNLASLEASIPGYVQSVATSVATSITNSVSQTINERITNEISGVNDRIESEKESTTSALAEVRGIVDAISGIYDDKMSQVDGEISEINLSVDQNASDISEICAFLTSADEEIKYHTEQLSAMGEQLSDVSEEVLSALDGVSDLWMVHNQLQRFVDETTEVFNNRFIGISGVLPSTTYVFDDVSCLDALREQQLLKPDRPCFAVISSEVDGIKSVTGYTWSSDLSDFVAMNGNYTASNVYFDRDLSLAGNYSSVGNIKKVEGGTIACKGRSVQDLFSDIFDATVPPTQGTNPSAKIDLSSDRTSYEVGETANIRYTASFTQGKYNYPWMPSGQQTGNDGTTVDSYHVKTVGGDTFDLSSSVVTHTFGDVTSGAKSKFYAHLSISYNAGSVPKNNKGQDVPSVQRAGGKTDVVKSSEITSYRNTFWYVGTDITSADDITGAKLREDVNQRAAGDVKTKALDIPDGAMAVCYAVKGENRTLKSVMEQNFGQNITQDFQRKVVNIEGADGYQSVPYTVFYTICGSYAGFAQNKYTFVVND